MNNREFEQIIKMQCDIGKAMLIPNDILMGNKSHAPKWHSCSVIEHIRWCFGIARMLYERCYVSEDLLYAAVYHDIGKVTNPIFEDKDPIFHGHAEFGASFLVKKGLVSSYVAELILAHGLHHKESYDKNVDLLLVYLDLCDEFAKWTKLRFPPEGREKQIVSRNRIVNHAITAGVGFKIIQEIENESNEIADNLGIIFDKGIKKWD